MRRLRWTLFIIAILFGIGLGLVFGWVLLPRTAVQGPFTSLRADYKTDAVLMVAESYAKQQNLAVAIQNLRRIGSATTPQELRFFITNAQTLGYSQADLKLMADLLHAVESAAPAGTAPLGATP